MKNKLCASMTLAWLSTLDPQLSTLLAQGSLTPPGAPAPTFKTLTQIEPRTAISSLPFTITAPGSYYLTTNLTGSASQHGITISANGVTLDLMGFELSGGVTNSLNGILVSGTRTNLAVRNGTVRNWGGDGVDAASALNGQYQDLRLSANGVAGLSCGSGSSVVKCSARGNTGDGILIGSGCTVSASVAHNNGGNGIVANFVNTGNTVSGCATYNNGVDGINISDGGLVSGCNARFNTGNGIAADEGGTIIGCTATQNGGDGIQVGSDGRVTDNTSDGNGRGIHVLGSDSRIEGNSVTDNDRGYTVAFAGNLIVRNSAAGSITVDWDMAANNVFGPILDRRAPANAGVFGAAAASSLGTTDANANFTY
jgi:parallel beta-helix repeat protein